MTSLWWLALPVLLLPVLWHRQKRERVKAQPLASARFLPRTDPQQQRVWQWADRFLLLLRCLLLAGVIAWLADLALPWRGDSVLVAAGSGQAWAEQQIAAAGFKDARRIDVPADALGWLRSHEREWRAGARLLVIGAVPMPAAQPQFRHSVLLRTRPAPFPKSEHRIAIVSARAGQWRALFAALDGPQRYLFDDAPNGKTELLIWDKAEAPPAGLRAPLWWAGDPAAFPELKGAKSVDGLRFVDSPRGRLWASAAWPPKDAGAARALFETWQRLHYAPVAYTAPPQTLASSQSAPFVPGSGALRGFLTIALIALFALERILAHARRR